jgi:flagellar hook-basal body complex protein FliE
MAMKPIDNSQLLAQMRQMAQSAGASEIGSINTNANLVNEAPAAGFGNMLSRAINNVNELQAETSRLRNAVEVGDGGVSLVKAMIASQKSSIAFQATLQVRNKVATAYKDIMNMPL